MTEYQCGNIVICGDLNPTNFDIAVILNELNLHNSVKEITRPASGTILDVVLVSEELYKCIDVQVGPPLQCDGAKGAAADHCVIRTTSVYNNLSCAKSHTVYDLRQSCVDAFVDELINVGFEDMYCLSDVNAKCEAFYRILGKGMKTLPQKSVLMTSRDKPWITPVIKKIITDRWNAYKHGNWPVYNHLKAKIKDMINMSKTRWSQNKTSTVKGLWDLVKDITGKSKCNDWLSKIYGSDCNIKAVLNEINNKFKAVFHDNPPLSIPDALPGLDESWHSDVNPCDVYRLLKNCSKKATGSDMIPSRLYSAASLILCDPLVDIIKCCLQTCVVPSIWKFLAVSPIPKTNPPNSDDLRPISSPAIPSNILEKCVLKNLNLSKLFGANQYAYTAKSSTTCALIALHELLTRLLDYEDTAAVILISWDYSKAFDCISHKILIDTLIECNLPSSFVSLIRNYLTDRTQAVKYGHTLSQHCTVTSGVPQGSVLGPFLFCIYISSLQPINTVHHMSKYADDLQTVSRIRKVAYDDDCAAAKENISHIKHWSAVHKLSLNVKKTKAVIFRKSKSHNINMRDIDPDILEVTCIKLLGVEINNELTWDNHIDSTVKICSQRMYSLRVLKPYLTTAELINVYYGCIRSKLEYCCQLFAGTTEKNKRKLRRVQRRFHGLCCGYDCNKICITDLDERRHDLCVRLWHQMHSPNHALHGLLPSQSVRTGHYHVEYCRTHRRRNCFIHLMTIDSNGL
jgi:hypothetical protein